MIGFDSLEQLLTEEVRKSDVSVDQILDGSVEINDKQIICFGAGLEYQSDEFFFLFEFNLDHYTLKLRMYTEKENEFAKSCVAVVQSVFQNL